VPMDVLAWIGIAAVVLVIVVVVVAIWHYPTDNSF
jgi:hypothetical protein